VFPHNVCIITDIETCLHCGLWCWVCWLVCDWSRKTPLQVPFVTEQLDALDENYVLVSS